MVRTACTEQAVAMHTSLSLKKENQIAGGIWKTALNYKISD
jgi:hypothetical protein